MRFAFACLALCSVGCTVDQLRFSTGRQGNTIIDLQYKQALDNVARFIAVPDSLPHFATTSTGMAQITDAAGLNALTFNWRPTLGSAAIGGSRTVLENWTLVPMLEPDRLQAMQLAFKMVTGGTFGPCDDLDLLQKFLVPYVPECQLPVGWYCVGKWWQVPKHIPHGHYDGVYVWVRPGRMADLSRFTVTLLMIAGIRNPQQMAAAAEARPERMQPYYELPKPQSFPQFYPQFRP